jgi:O-acetyl-ADP-ribose deacetylase (regulator of RNase III)
MAGGFGPAASPLRAPTAGPGAGAGRRRGIAAIAGRPRRGKCGIVAGVRITLALGDITQQHVDAVVNAANSSLLGGGGVDGAIHRRGGPAILAACRDLRAGAYQDGLPVGGAVATTAGDLPARWVIHTVGPVWSGREDRSALLASCYSGSLRVADELGARTVAFPAVSTGAFGWPFDDAARIAVSAVRAAQSGVEEARFVLFSEHVLAAFRAATG